MVQAILKLVNKGLAEPTPRDQKGSVGGENKFLAEAKSHLFNVHYILLQAAESAEVRSNAGSNTGVETRDHDRKGERLCDFHEKEEAKTCNLTLVEVASLRLYTSSSFSLVNQPLRKSSMFTKEQRTENKHPLAFVTYHISNGLKKLRAMNFKIGETQDLSKADYLWRGLKDVAVSDHVRSLSLRIRDSKE